MTNDNLFSNVSGVEELIGQVVGAGSMCWTDLSGAGAFNTAQARRIADDAITRLSELIGNPACCASCDGHSCEERES